VTITTPQTERGLSGTGLPHRSAFIPLPLSKPLFTQLLLGINVMIWLAETLAGGSTNTQTLIRFGAKVNDLIVQGEYWRLLTPIFLHAGIAHLAFNMYALYVLGMEVERLFGRSRFLVLYFLSGLGGSVLSFLYGARISVGASGAIFGLAGALVAYFARHREVFGRRGRQQLVNIVAVVGINLIIGFSLPGIDNLGHLGGLIVGLAMGWQFTPHYEVDLDWKTSSPVLRDRNSLRPQWVAVLVVVLVLVGSTAAGVEAQSKSAITYLRAANTLIDQGNYARAEKVLQIALERDPQSAPGYFLLGYALGRQEKYEQAAEAYQQAIKLQPKMAEAYWNLGLTFLALNRRREARAAFETYLTLDISSQEAAQARAMLQRIAP